MWELTDGCDRCDEWDRYEQYEGCVKDDRCEMAERSAHGPDRPNWKGTSSRETVLRAVLGATGDRRYLEQADGLAQLVLSSRRAWRGEGMGSVRFLTVGTRETRGCAPPGQGRWPPPLALRPCG